MVQHQPLSALFSHLALRVRQHGSSSSCLASRALDRASSDVEENSGQRVPQCDELDHALSIARSRTMSLLREAQPSLRWTQSAAGSKPAHVQRTIAAVEMVGPSGMVLHDDCRVGLFLQCRHSDYPTHHHAAEELYLVLSGRALWSRAASPPEIMLPGTFISHTAWEVHSMKTQAEPLIALWCWTGDTRLDQYKLLNSVKADCLVDVKTGG